MNWLRELLEHASEDNGDLVVLLACLIVAVAWCAGFI